MLTRASSTQRLVYSNLIVDVNNRFQFYLDSCKILVCDPLAKQNETKQNEKIRKRKIENITIHSWTWRLNPPDQSGRRCPNPRSTGGDVRPGPLLAVGAPAARCHPEPHTTTWMNPFVVNNGKWTGLTQVAFIAVKGDFLFVVAVVLQHCQTFPRFPPPSRNTLSIFFLWFMPSLLEPSKWVLKYKTYNYNFI